MSEAAAKSGQTLQPVVVLVAICVVAGALLGAVHEATAPLAAANAEQKAQETYATLVPQAATFVPVACDVPGCTAALEARDAAGTLVAHVIVAQSKGYGGQVPIAVAFGPDGKALGMVAMSNDETPGLGSKIADEAFINQFVGHAAQPATADDVDLISGATISSKAALSAFNIAVEAYEEVR